MKQLRRLTADDAQRLEAFLVEHADSSMVLRSNLARAGVVFTGQRLGGEYVGAFEHGELVGVVGHAWNGMLVLQAPTEAAELSVAVLRSSGRPLTGLLGPWPQLEAAREALGLSPAAFRMREKEQLMAVGLADVRGAGKGVRVAQPRDLEVVAQLREAFEVEAIAETPSPAYRVELAQRLAASAAQGDLFVLEEAGTLVATGAFNARLPDSVQLGGIYTPPELRGRGYARQLVAGMLRSLHGVERALLFTKNPSAEKAYAAVGFRSVGTYGLALLREPSG